MLQIFVGFERSLSRAIAFSDAYRILELLVNLSKYVWIYATNGYAPYRAFMSTVLFRLLTIDMHQQGYLNKQKVLGYVIS